MNDLQAWMRGLLLEEPPVPRSHTGLGSLPVPVFGALSPDVEAAALAWNPSYEEIRRNRIPVLSDFGVACSADLTSDHLEQIEFRLSRYFHQPSGPTEFFRKLGPLLAAAGRSFESGKAVHLDLSPWPTKQRWKGLAPDVRNHLLTDGVIKLVQFLKLSAIKVLFVNGADVYTGLRRGLEFARQRCGLPLGNAPYAPVSIDSPLVECSMSLFEPGGNRQIQICFWQPFIYAGYHKSTSDLEEALRTRFNRGLS